jgi:hypothetical protein
MPINYLKRAVNKILSILKQKIHVESVGYENITPGSGYAPWQLDKVFLEAYSIIKNYTLVDKYRCYELWQLVKESSKIKGDLIEIGVWKGGTGALISRAAIMSNINDHVFLCDTFNGVVKNTNKDHTYMGGEHSNASIDEVDKLLNKLNLQNFTILQGIFPEETSTILNNKIFRFCHIDVDVYQSAKDIIRWIWPKMCIGAIIVYDDYGFESCDGITCFVNEEREKGDRLVIHNLNGHAVVIKIK